GKSVPDLCVQLVATTSPHGSITCGGGKKTMAPFAPSHETWVSLGQIIWGRHWSVVWGQSVTITWKEQQFISPWPSLRQQTTVLVPGGKKSGPPPGGGGGVQRKTK